MGNGVELVTGGRVLTGFGADGHSEWLADAAVAVRQNLVEAVGPIRDLLRRYPDAIVHGGPSFTVIPGLVNAHHHVGLTPFQLGSADHPLEMWFASRLALPAVDLELDTLYSAMEMITSGVTTVQHLHSRAPGDVDALVEAAARVVGAYQRIGMRVSYSMGLRDQNRLVYGDDEAFASSVTGTLGQRLRRYFAQHSVPLAEQAQAFHELRNRFHGLNRTAVQLAPTNLHWLSDDALTLVAELHSESGAPMHMHLLETPYQFEYARRRTGGSAVSFLEKRGLLTGGLTLGHGVWMTDEDIDHCAAAGVRICHNRSSNFRLASGVAPVNSMIGAGLEVAIGIDEAGLNDDRDMLQEMRLVFTTSREVGLHSPRLSADRVLQMATAHGAATTPFAGQIGALRPGLEADLVMLDWDDVTYPFQHPGTPISDVLVQRATPRSVHSVMIGGDWVLRDRQFTTVDRSAVLAEIARHLKDDFSHADVDREFADETLPFARGFYDDYDLTQALNSRSGQRR